MNDTTLYKIIRMWTSGHSRTVMLGIYYDEVLDWCSSEHSRGYDWLDGCAPMTPSEIKRFHYRYRGYKDKDIP